jgi:hypothetical protein
MIHSGDPISLFRFSKPLVSATTQDLQISFASISRPGRRVPNKTISPLHPKKCQFRRQRWGAAGVTDRAVKCI